MMPLPQALLQALRQALPYLPPPVTAAPAESIRLPAAPGTYLLLARLDAPLALQGRFAGGTLPRGWFAYAGSARGPGGLAARLSRHLRAEKRPRWHIDQLTTHADMICALPFPDTENATAPSECTLAAWLLESGLFSPPVPGFGSSDCRTCPAHLLWWRCEEV